MEKQLTETLMLYLTQRRMSSLGNLSLHFEKSLEELTPVVRTLAVQNRLRLTQPRCAGSCSECNSCEVQTAAPAISQKTIAISLEQMEQ